MIEHPGSTVLAVFGQAADEAVIIAPFIKLEALRKVLNVLPSECSLSVITRWRPEEVQAGVSDLGVWDELALRPKAVLWLCDQLHAKYYRADGVVLLGSANLTGLGMGWRTGANIELLRKCLFDESLANFEHLVGSRSVRASVEIKNAIEAAVAALKSADYSVPSHPAMLQTQMIDDLGPLGWLPRSRYPSNLWLFYTGQLDRLTTAAREDAAFDLSCLRLPQELSEDAFGRYIAVILMQQPVVLAVDSLTNDGVRFGTIRNTLRSNAAVAASARDPSELLQTLIRWLLHFLSDVYELKVARYTEVLKRR